MLMLWLVEVTAIDASVAAGMVPLPPPPHPATKATSSNAINHLSGLVTLPNLFILLLLFNLIPKNIGVIDCPLLVVILMCYANIRTCIATGETTSHLTKLSKNDSQVIGHMRAAVWSAPIQNRINRN
jgi:hypothetical protein